MAVAVAETALELADEFRRGRTTCRPSELWKRADAEANGVRTARLTILQHAMIHAGYLTTRKGSPYKRCPMCHRPLPPNSERR